MFLNIALYYHLLDEIVQIIGTARAPSMLFISHYTVVRCRTSNIIVVRHAQTKTNKWCLLHVAFMINITLGNR